MRHALPLFFALFFVACTEPSRDAGGSNGAAAPAKRDHRKVVAEGGALIDVRTPEEFSAKHVEGAKNIPVDELVARLSEIPKGKPVVVYCASGARSSSAAGQLKGAGYDVIDVGGMRNW